MLPELLALKSNSLMVWKVGDPHRDSPGQLLKLCNHGLFFFFLSSRRKSVIVLFQLPQQIWCLLPSVIGEKKMQVMNQKMGGYRVGIVQVRGSLATSMLTSQLVH